MTLFSLRLCQVCVELFYLYAVLNSFISTQSLEANEIGVPEAVPAPPKQQLAADHVVASADRSYAGWLEVAEGAGPGPAPP
jgi:hypothetical protein